MLQLGVAVDLDVRGVAVAGWVADLHATVADKVGTSGRCPSESTIRRTVQDIDADAFDTVNGGFVQRLCDAAAVSGRRRVLTVDGKTLRGSRIPSASKSPNSQPAVRTGCCRSRRSSPGYAANSPRSRA